MPSEGGDGVIIWPIGNKFGKSDTREEKMEEDESGPLGRPPNKEFVSVSPSSPLPNSLPYSLPMLPPLPLLLSEISHINIEFYN
jgi:hypothetical protein